MSLTQPQERMLRAAAESDGFVPLMRGEYPESVGLALVRRRLLEQQSPHGHHWRITDAGRSLLARLDAARAAGGNQTSATGGRSE